MSKLSCLPRLSEQHGDELTSCSLGFLKGHLWKKIQQFTHNFLFSPTQLFWHRSYSSSQAHIHFGNFIFNFFHIFLGMGGKHLQEICFFFPHLVFNYINFGAYELFSLIRSVVILHELILCFTAESKLNSLELPLRCVQCSLRIKTELCVHSLDFSALIHYWVIYQRCVCALCPSLSSNTY